MNRGGWYLGLAGLLASASSLAQGPSPATPSDPAAARFFETKIRPVLAENCFKCHGPEKQRAGLRLDSRAAILKGGESGPAVVPHKPEISLLIDAVNHGDVVQMPPTGKLSGEIIADLTTWVRMGAPWPNRKDEGGRMKDEASDSSFILPPSSFQHWSFQPLRESPVPVVNRTDWPRSAIDYFVLSQLEAKGLEPAPPADHRTLIRRVTFDLTGLPPTPEEINAFEQYAIRNGKPCRSPAGLAALRRALGPPLARCGPLRRQQRRG